ncbi:Ig-like domain-containing protein [Paludisphaera sp.]|uniref:Ig-like domain-containing protein n=1 Tax=Paludisphaera sp. TaxID=2017432 RepID=UPI00301D8AFE
MRTGATDVASRGLRKGLRLDARLKKVRRKHLRRCALEWLEARTLLAVLPAPQAGQFVENAINRAGGNVSSPTVAVDRYNPWHLVSVWTRNDPDLAPGNTTRVEGAYSNDGGKTWNSLGTSIAPSVRTDPTIKPGPGINTDYRQTLDPQVAFDNQHNIYVLVRQANNDLNTSGALVLRKFSFQGSGEGVGAPVQDGGDRVVRQYVVDQVFNPTLTVDDNLPFFQDPETGHVQTNPYAGNVWVGWSTSEARPTGVFNQEGSIWNPNSIQVVTSSDGGLTFSGATQANNQSRWTGQGGVFALATPKIVVGQGKAGPAAQAAANAGGGATVIWDNFGRDGANAGNTDVIPDLIQSNAVSGAHTYTMPGATGAIANATGSAAPFGEQTTDFAIPVSFGGAFGALAKLTVNMTLQQENMAWLRAELIAPDGRSVLLFSNAQGVNGQAPPNDYTFGVTGKNLGIVGAFNRNETAYGIVGSTFDDAAPRSINDRAGAGTGYTGHYRTEAQRNGNANGLAKFNGSTAAQLTGTWTLRFTAYGNIGTSDTALLSQLRNLSLTFTDGVVADGSAETVATTQVRGSQNGMYSRIAFAAGIQGIGPGIDAAQDNTLGSFSQHQGRIYVTYTGFRAIEVAGVRNPGDNTDIYLVTSDDGGRTWTPRGIVNDDDGATDGFSGANADPQRGPVTGRPQFLPQVAVDQTTGSVVMSWRDARHDPARARTAVYVAASIDGGATFSEQSHANPSQSSFDPITRQTVNLNPAGDNLRLQEPSPAAFGYGTQMGLAVGGGQVYMAWAGNLNRSHLNSANAIWGDPLRTYVARMTIAAGPRAIDGTKGPVDTSAGVSVNSFIVEFDRPIDAPGFAPTFTAEDVKVYYRGTSNSDPYIEIAATSVTPVAASLVPGFGYTRFLVTFPTGTAVGTYSYVIRPEVGDRVRTVPGGLVGGTRSGNLMDQDADGVAGQDPLTRPSGDLMQGYTPGDYFSTPELARVFQTWSNAAGGPATPGSLVAQILGSRIAATSLPIILPGAHAIASGAENDGGSPENLVLNKSTSYLSVTFDRPIRAATFTPADVLRLMGPTGSLTGRQYFQADRGGRAIPAPASATVPGILESTLTVPSYFGSTFVASDLTVTVSATFPTLAGLSLELVSPTGATVPLVAAGGLRGADLTNTVFDDAAARSITNGTAPYTGSFRPATGSLSALAGASIQGTWTLRVINTAARTVGTLTGWSLGATPTIRVEPVSPTTAGGQQVASTFRIHFPTQVLSGTYTVQLGSDITDVNGQRLDRSLNAGLDVRRGDADRVPVAAVSYGSGVVNQPLAGGALTSTVQVPDNFIVQGTTTTAGVSGLRLLLSLSSPDVSKLRATLTHNGVSVVLFASLVQGTNSGGFTNVIFDDRAATPISQASPPYTGASFNPLLPLLSGGFEGATSGGDWELTIEGTEPGASALLSSWTLLFQKPLPTSGLGEAVADQTSLSFRVFQTDVANALSHNTWTSVGAASVLPGATTGSAGQVTAIAQDPSDPTGNTFYIGGASGGVWKTTNFLTDDPGGPTYIPLTDFGPAAGLNIGAITVFPRNNDPRQSIVIAATGNVALGGNGVGFLMSMDGGATWKLLDSTTNVDASGMPLPLNSASRDRAFVGASVYKVVVDPRLTLQGQVIIYAALTGPNGGLWRSTDTGDHWTLMRAGQATDVVLDPTSNTGGGTDPNLLRLYAGFANEGVYLSPNRGQNWNPLSGNVGNPLLIDVFDDRPVGVATIGPGPMGAGGRVILGKPALTGNANQDLLYAGWLYAAVGDGGGGLRGLYMTKDFGQNWVQVRFPNAPRADGTAFANPDNNVGLYVFDYDLTTAGQALSLEVDPADPNVVYLGGAHDQSTSAIMRLDATRIWDAYNLTLYSAISGDGLSDWQSTGPVTPGNRVDSRPSTVLPVANDPPGFLNYIRDPNDPFAAPGTRFVNNLNQLTNNGAGVRWTPFDPPIGQGQSPTYQRLVAMIDPMTGMTRLIYGTNRGVWSVLDDDGRMLAGENVGTAPAPGANRNGNLAIGQFYYGAVQPSARALASHLNYDRALFYASSNDQSQFSGGGILDNGDLSWAPTRFPVFPPTMEGVNAGGVAVDPQGSGTLYQAFQSGTMPTNLETTFFRVNHVGSTFGLFLGAGDLAQWNATSGATFAVNPVSGDQIVISSATGRIYSSTDRGANWFEIGAPGTFGSPGNYSEALAYGAPQPGATVGDLGNFMYVGTVGGRIFMTQTGGGGLGNEWREVSAGLDGSAIQRIVPSPTRGDRSAYAVTAEGVYRIADSAAADATWVPITGNLRGLSFSIFGETYSLSDADPLRQTLALSAMAVDWRYSIPNAQGDPTGAGRHPVLYVAGNAGVFRSLDNGLTWAPFPNQDVDGAQVRGGLLPRATITDLDLSLGDINPATGVPDLMGKLDPYAPNPHLLPNDPNVLYATTWGRGAYAIRMAPLILPGTARVNPANVSGIAPDGTPIVRTASFGISGLSMASGFNNATRITIYSVTDGRVVAGFNPANVAGTNVRANWTDINGDFNIQIPDDAFTTNGTKVLRIQATDDTGSVGNEVTITLTLDANLQPPTVPITPTLRLDPADNTGLVPSENYTSHAIPDMLGITSRNVAVRLFYSGDGGATWHPSPATTSDANGAFSLPLADINGNRLPDGTYRVAAAATNSHGNSPFSPITVVRIKTQAPTAAPTLALNPGYDSGIVGDGITNIRKPVFTGSVGAANGGSTVRIYRADGTNPSGPIIAQARADAQGNFSVQLPLSLDNGVITLTATAVDPAGNLAPGAAAPLTVTIVTTALDFSGNARDHGGSSSMSLAQGTLLVRNTTADRGLWYGWLTPPTYVSTWYQNGASVGGAAEVPMVGDFDADGREDLASFNRSSQTWSVAMSGGGNLSFAFGAGPNSLPLVGNFDGAGATQYGIFEVRDGVGEWRMTSAGGGFRTFSFGQTGDYPLTGDFLGKGYDQAAVYRPGTGQFLVYDRDTGTSDVIATMAPNQIPVPGYFENLAYRWLGQKYRMTPAVFNPATGVFTIERLPNSPYPRTAVFRPGDIPASGDYAGVGWDLPVVYRPSVGNFLVKNDQRQSNGVDAIIARFPGAVTGAVVPVGAPLAYRTLSAAELRGGVSPLPMRGSGSGFTTTEIAALAIDPAALAAAATAAPSTGDVGGASHGAASFLPTLGVAESGPSGARRPVFVGTATPGTTVALAVNAAGPRGARRVGVATADAAGSYTFQLPAGFRLGKYTLVASSEGADGSTTPIASTRFEIKPAPRLRTPALGRFARPVAQAARASAPAPALARAIVASAPAPVAPPSAADPISTAIDSLDGSPFARMRRKPS